LELLEGLISFVYFISLYLFTDKVPLENSEFIPTITKEDDKADKSKAKSLYFASSSDEDDDKASQSNEEKPTKVDKGKRPLTKEERDEERREYLEQEENYKRARRMSSESERIRMQIEYDALLAQRLHDEEYQKLKNFLSKNLDNLQDKPSSESKDKPSSPSKDNNSEEYNSDCESTYSYLSSLHDSDEGEKLIKKLEVKKIEESLPKKPKD
jgi:hypothetical protein